ncbi:MAG: hypothetical protein ACUVQZ_08465 [Candidatus Caldatribacteriaceae bacterium]
MQRKIFLWLLVFVLLVYLSGCVSSGNDTENIRKVIEGYFGVLNEPNEAKARNYVLPESAAWEWLDEFFTNKVPLAESQGVRYEYRVNIQKVKVDSSKGKAWVDISYTFVAVGYGGLSAPEFETTVILKKQGERWLIEVAFLAS